MRNLWERVRSRPQRRCQLSCCPAVVSFLSSFRLDLGLEEKGATFFLLGKVARIIPIALIDREIILRRLRFTALPGSALAVELLQFHF